MIASLKWLQNYVDISIPVQELVTRLTMAGLEVEAVRNLDAQLQQVVTVRVESIEPHPKADRLHLCQVADDQRTYRVVCGAPNLQVGKVVPLALPGARLADGEILKAVEIRGEMSQGMLCSQRELGLGDDADGVWLLAPDTPVGIPVAQVMGDGDVIIDIGITPNRGDCLSIIGIAREISAICGSPLRYPDIALSEGDADIGSLSSVTVDDPVGCPRYAARIVQGVKISGSPAWLRQKLEAVGIRSINNIVDVTNFILMEMGQPLHAFDFDRLAENRIVVRRAGEGERFTTLDAVERVLFADTLLICDGRNPVAIAGIMGGLDSEIKADTTRVLIESAYFQPQCIRRSSKKLGLRTESSFRFERGVDPAGLVRALDRAAQLMVEVAGGEIARGRIDVYPHPIEPPVLRLRVDRTNRLLGTRLKSSQMAEVLRRIEMQVKETDSNCLEVVPPLFRPDITREVDLAEEIARLVGYDKVPVTAPQAAVEAASFDPHLRARQEVKFLLQGAAFFEVLNYSFIAEESIQRLRLPVGDPRLSPVRLMNPLSEEQAVMRTSLVPGLLETVRYNFDHGNDDLRIFELSKVFSAIGGADLPEERHQLVGAMAGRLIPDPLYGGREEVGYVDVKGTAESILSMFYLEGVAFAVDEAAPYLDPKMMASVYCKGEYLGCLGRVHPEVEEAFDLKRAVYLFEFDFDRLFNLRSSRPLFRPLPKFPSVTRDMAIVVDAAVRVQEPLDYILELKEPLLELVDVFDVFKSEQLGAGKRSIGYRLVYRAADRNLTDEEVNAVHQRLVDKVLGKFGATLR
ncbi:phenylalanine--tRNA ligase subunit beta [Desulfoferrobacter suflitae]|uniref:phenylalanine--tRNA ligase subunit beta n=1 Tax=Desulfoferrobacter suflitae TaxID=2865782 RepID=UPI0021646607|nr:phenylalanine--tRNA ligase subunit beta [Desulfoferrobacter suflitae]MCK8602544.1 phenylalanine--tRNA ligase subunit beta [Desulfoferrobacter suflitae]